ncbi:MAG: hypothetical protein KKA42_09880, partial [candidate division Zixibacteria bacterium]|nr:hypothetical protein [candidate division Zixibacteria bacterium]
MISKAGTSWRRRLSLAALTFIWCCLAVLPLQAATETVLTYSFERPSVERVTIGGEAYDRIVMDGVPNCGNAGEPALPAQGATILLPLGSRVTGITVTYSDRILLGEDYLVEPVGFPIKLSSDPRDAQPVVPDDAIYNSRSAFPSSRQQDIGIQSFRGYSLQILKLNPMEYLPATGELYYYPELTVTVSTEDAGTLSPLYRGLPQDEFEVSAKIDNPDDVRSTARASSGAKAYDLLIITTPDLAGYFQPLKDYHDSTGMLTEIHTTADIGSNAPDDVRNYILSKYTSDGIDYVLIGADDNLIPAKDLWVEAWSGGDIETNMPGDVFFGCLDGTYNYDGDSR